MQNDLQEVAKDTFSWEKPCVDSLIFLTEHFSHSLILKMKMIKTSYGTDIFKIRKLIDDSGCPRLSDIKLF